MTMSRTLDLAQAEASPPVRATRVQFMALDDKAMLRAARDLTKGLGEAKPAVYWTDMLVSAGVGYAGIAVAILSGNLAVQIAAGLVAALATPDAAWAARSDRGGADATLARGMAAARGARLVGAAPPMLPELAPVDLA